VVWEGGERKLTPYPIPYHYGFSHAPRGLGLATATTSAAFLPHCEQRIRSARAWSITFQPTRRARASGFVATLVVALFSVFLITPLALRLARVWSQPVALIGMAAGALWIVVVGFISCASHAEICRDSLCKAL
jgi:hypothetical protein